MINALKLFWDLIMGRNVVFLYCSYCNSRDMTLIKTIDKNILSAFEKNESYMCKCNKCGSTVRRIEEWERGV